MAFGLVSLVVQLHYPKRIRNLFEIPPAADVPMNVSSTDWVASEYAAEGVLSDKTLVRG
jgi:hypothetical protein